MSSYNSTSIVPDIADTTVIVHGGHSSLAAIRIGQAATIQFSDPTDAREWLLHCLDSLAIEAVNRAARDAAVKAPTPATSLAAPMCRAEHDDGYICTLHVDHDGEHVERGSSGVIVDARRAGWPT